MKNICILDYGMGNIHSLKNAITKIGHKPILFSEKNKIEGNLLVIPGVGAFDTAMKIFKKKKLDKVISKFLCNDNNFLLGICLGKHLLYKSGNENKPNEKGLGYIDGEVKIFSNLKNIKLPNIGWIKTNFKNNNKFNFLEKFNNEKFYYVHSYVGSPNDKSAVIATANYGNNKFCAMVSNNNIIGTQFHPEKSSYVGLEFLENIVQIV
jgi:imidazole glycerol-phosphate synthase subunit HisH